MKFIKQGDTLKEVTAMALSPNWRFLAVCERHWSNLNAFISIYDMKTTDFKLEKSKLQAWETEPSQ